MKTTKKWKMALLTWLTIYPLINLIFILLMPFIQHWPLLLKTLLTTVILVQLMGSLLSFLQKCFHNWLNK